MMTIVKQIEDKTLKTSHHNSTLNPPKKILFDSLPTYFRVKFLNTITVYKSSHKWKLFYQYQM